MQIVYPTILKMQDWPKLNLESLSPVLPTGYAQYF